MLLEREQLLEALYECVIAARDGDGSLVLVAGEAGAGKSSLTRHLTESLDGSVLVITGACDPLSTPRPLSPLRDFAADEDSGLHDLEFESSHNMDLFRDVLDRLKTSIRPIVMVIEDVHWADEATLDFIRFIGRRVSETRAVFICTYRDDELGPDHHLRPVLGQLIPLSSTSRLSVPMLSLAAVKTLTAGTDIDPAPLHALTGGNAFYVTEVIASGDPSPSTVQEAVLARLATLDGGPRQVVQAVSIAPRDLEIDRALLLVGGETDHIDQAVSSGMILGDGRVLRFRHELARSAVERSVPPARRHELHSRMLALLLEEDPADHARLAHHAIQARSPELIVQHAPPAAEEAINRGSRREGVEFYRAVLEHSSILEPEREAELRLKLGTELRYLDQPEPALAEVDSAIAFYRTSEAKRNLAEALLQRHQILWMLSRIQEGWDAGNEAIDLLRPLGPTRELGLALYRSAHSHMLARHAAPAHRDADEALSIGKAVGSEEVVWLAQMIQGTIEVVVGDGPDGVRRLEKSRKSAVEMGNRLFETIALVMWGSGGGEFRLYESALEALDAGIEIGIDNDDDYTVAYALAWKARIAFEQGRWDDAITDAERALRVSARSEGVAFLTAMGTIGRVRVRRGDPRGRETLERVLESGRTSELQHIWSPLSGLVEYHWMREDQDLMLDLLSEPFGRALDTDSQWARGELGFWMWRAGGIAEPPHGAATPFAAQVSGDWRSAASLWREIGCPYEVGLSLAEGNREANLEALSIFDSLGAKPIADRLRARLRSSGVESVPRGPSASTRQNPSGLTNRQTEVLRLMHEGLSNGEIAERLYISKKTVEHHVSAILTKLGVDTRAKAVAALNK